MSAMSGDLLGITGVFMPSGFSTQTVAPAPRPGVIGILVAPPEAPGETLFVSVEARLALIAAVQPVLAHAVSVDGQLSLGGDIRPITYNEEEVLLLLTLLDD